MSLVNLASGGLDSTLVSAMAKREEVDVYPLFINYGQRSARREWEACQHVHKTLHLRDPVSMDISGFGHVIQSGLTSTHLDVREDAFTPGRNLMFLLMGCAYAFQVGADVVSIGLLSERSSFFPDQKGGFLQLAEQAISSSLGRGISIIAPLFEFTKADVVALAHEYGIVDTYSCHGGGQPCGRCISCLEFETMEGG